MIDLTQAGIKYSPAEVEVLLSNLMLHVRETLALSYLGARVCYSDQEPPAIIEELEDKEKVFKLLKNLQKAGHHSIFAHSPLLVDWAKASQDFRLLRPAFKTYFLSPAMALITLRHITEVVPQSRFSSLLLEDYEIPTFEKYNSDHIKIWVHKYPIGPSNWFSVFVTNVSRVFSHQLVRHTTINFNQRSHRYTKADKKDFIIPPESIEEADTIFSKVYNQTYKAYKKLISLGVHQENARFVLPNGHSTTLLCSAPDFVWKDFVVKRKHKKAQWEIREFASLLDEVLFKT